MIIKLNREEIEEIVKFHLNEKLMIGREEIEEIYYDVGIDHDFYGLEVKIKE